jgi:hypothetical protein
VGTPGRAIGLDVQLEFCGVAIVEGGAVRSAGRVVSQAGFDGGLVSRILSSGEETLRGHGTSEEIPG